MKFVDAAAYELGKNGGAKNYAVSLDSGVAVLWSSVLQCAL